MKYKNPENIDIQQAEEMFLIGTDTDICNALLSVSLYGSDWRWAQNKCISFLSYSNYEVSQLAATCLGHIARVHKKIDRDLVVTQLMKYKNDPNMSGYIQDAIDDIDMFIKLN